MFCGVCNRAMYAQNNGDRDKLRYRCASMVKPEHTQCGNGSVWESAVVDFAWPLVASIIKDPDVITRAIQNVKDEKTDPQLEFDLQSFRSGLERCEKEIKSLIKRMASFANDEYIGAEIERQIISKKHDRDQYKGLIADVERRMAANLKQAVDLTDLQAYCDEVRDVIDGFGFEEKRLAIEALRVKVYITKGKKRADKTQMRLDVPVAVKKAIGYEVPMELIAADSVTNSHTLRYKA